ncbi:MAG: DUF3943 domain-containing protein [Muribaculaceae bacterium]|nr:DUF3943 domain-containing protein [Muribaculaceae bacterium]
MKKLSLNILLSAVLAVSMSVSAAASDVDTTVVCEETVVETVVETPLDIKPLDIKPLVIDSAVFGPRRHRFISPYTLPYTRHAVNPDWHRMWINTAVLSGAYISTLFVLEMLPEDATSWNRAYINQTPMFKRWFKNVFKRGPEWDHDNPVFNYVLHPYAGAVYFMSARSCGFSFWGSFLYSAAISTIGWEFGIEAFMERPSYQDIVITPVVGSIMGELFYRAKHEIVNRGYELLGSYFLGRAACFLMDPVNEVIDLFRGNPNSNFARSRRVTSSFMPTGNGFALAINF